MKTTQIKQEILGALAGHQKAETADAIAHHLCRKTMIRVVERCCEELVRGGELVLGPTAGKVCSGTVSRTYALAT